MSAEEWTTAEHALRYLARADAYPHRAEGEGVLLEQVPGDVRRVLDLGTGDGRLLALLRIDRRQMLSVGLDFSEPMLEAARKRFTDDGLVELVEHDLADPLRARALRCRRLVFCHSPPRTRAKARAVWRSVRFARTWRGVREP